MRVLVSGTQSLTCGWTQSKLQKETSMKKSSRSAEAIIG